MIPLGIRCRNPGNIEKNNRNDWVGQIRPGLHDRFCTFETPEYGLRAIMVLIKNYSKLHNINTLRGIIERWAPPVENATEVYIQNVSKWSGIKPDTEHTVTNFDFMVGVARGIVRQENGKPSNGDTEYSGNEWWYSDKVYQNAYEMAVKGKIVTHTRNKIPPKILKTKEEKTFWQKVWEFLGNLLN